MTKSESRWQQPPFVAVRRTRHGTWVWEARENSYRAETRSDREYPSSAGAQRAAKKVAAAKGWPVVVLPPTQTIG